jgi:hypothetical protein
MIAKGGSRMSGRSARWIVPIVVVGMVFVAACSSPGPSGSAPAISDQPVRSPTGSIPAVASQPLTTETRSPTLSPSAEPPPASLKAEGGDPAVGQLGSYTWNGRGSDSPWLQGSPIHVGSGEPVTVTLAGNPAIDSWTVQRVPGGATGGSGAVAMGSGEGTPIGFVAPAPGSWSILVDVRFADGSDAAAYYWLLDVG